MYHSQLFQVPNGWTTISKSKRTFDILVSLAMLIIFAPLMLSIAIWLALSSRGPVIYAHTRVGKGGKLFKCYKFRTMVLDAEQRLNELLASNPAMRKEWENSRKLRNDPRIIPSVGSLLRKSSLDELPQIFNVLRGDMSVVGPRPIVEEELKYYGPYRGTYLSVRPGLTGPWQATDRSDDTYDERVRKDAEYVENGTLGTDISVIATTARKLLNFKLTGAY